MHNLLYLANQNTVHTVVVLKHWLSVHSNGDIYPCGRYYPEEYRLGNIMDFNDLHDVFETKIYKNIINKSAIRKQKCREQCNVYIFVMADV